MACRKCGKCCHDIPLSASEAAMFQHILNCKGLEFNAEVLKDSNYKYKLVGQCPFLREDNLCDIYEFRPHICRIFPLTDCEELSR
jgi:Fe-S-cluster containining protein